MQRPIMDEEKHGAHAGHQDERHDGAQKRTKPRRRTEKRIVETSGSGLSETIYVQSSCKKRNQHPIVYDRQKSSGI